MADAAVERNKKVAGMKRAHPAEGAGNGRQRPAAPEPQSGRSLCSFTGSLSLRFIAVRTRMLSASTAREKAMAK